METLESLKPICEQIEKCLAEKISDIPEEIIGKIGELKNLLATSSNAVAASKVIYKKRISALTLLPDYKDYNTTEKKMIFEGIAVDELYYMTLCEKHNSGIVHSIDGLRSVLSFLKTEMSYLPNN